MLTVILVLLRRHHETNLSRYEAAESSLADQSYQESNKLREKLANAKGKKKRPEQRKENNGFIQMQVLIAPVLYLNLKPSLFADCFRSALVL